MPLTIIQRYENAIADKKITDDIEQRKIIAHLDTLSLKLNKKKSWFRKKGTLRGIYLYGPVGRGKSFLIDLFFDSVKKQRKIRIHFHKFMQQIDSDLRKFQGVADPLKTVAKNLSKHASVICLDEFLVHDIADAMILTKLLPYLIKNNIILVITANTPPDNLYLHGLQRREFLPAIELLKEHCEVLKLQSITDYRLKELKELEAYLWPINKENEEKFEKEFRLFSSNYRNEEKIIIQNRTILCKKISEKAVWFDFDVICNIPRSQLDYLELAQKFKIFFISGVKPLQRLSPSRASLFIKLIDVLYDKKNKLIILATHPINELYVDGSLLSSFERTTSRLYEMGSKEYLVSNCE